MDLYISNNGWLAWVEIDPIANNDVFTSNSEGKQFVIVGFLPSGQFCIAPDSYTRVEQAQEIISSLDNQTIAFECGDHLIKVFSCFDGSYWWQASSTSQIKHPPQRSYTAQNITEAVELAGSQLCWSTFQPKSSRRSRSTCRLPLPNFS